MLILCSCVLLFSVGIYLGLRAGLENKLTGNIPPVEHRGQNQISQGNEAVPGAACKNGTGKSAWRGNVFGVTAGLKSLCSNSRYAHRRRTPGNSGDAGFKRRAFGSGFQPNHKTCFRGNYKASRLVLLGRIRGVAVLPV